VRKRNWMRIRKHRRALQRLSRPTLKIALLHWYRANLTASFPVGLEPNGLAFDGAGIWVAAWNTNKMHKFRVSRVGSSAAIP
jgi:hypothetical protein